MLRDAVTVRKLELAVRNLMRREEKDRMIQSSFSVIPKEMGADAYGVTFFEVCTNPVLIRAVSCGDKMRKKSRPHPAKRKQNICHILILLIKRFHNSALEVIYCKKNSKAYVLEVSFELTNNLLPLQVPAAAASPSRIKSRIWPVGSSKAKDKSM